MSQYDFDNSNFLNGDEPAVVKVAGTDYASQITNHGLTNEESNGGTLTIWEAASGSKRKHHFTASAVQDLQFGSFWRFCRDNVGVEVPVVYKPYGDEAPTVQRPYLEFNAKVSAPPTVGGQPAIDGDYFTFDIDWVLTSAPKLNDGTDTKARVTGAQPTTGAGVGDPIIFTGSQLADVTAVKFGTKVARKQASGDNYLVVTVPTGVTGAQTVTFTNGGGDATVDYTTAS
jgi:hypothetical protein